MNKKISINDRIFCNIEKYCKSNKQNVNSYIENALSDKINIDMYGDLNELKKQENNEIKISKIRLDIEEKIIYLYFENTNTPIKLKLNNIENFEEALKKWNNVDNNNIIDNNASIKRKLKIK